MFEPNENLIFEVKDMQRLRYLSDKVQQRTKAALGSYICSKLITNFNDFKKKKIHEYNLKFSERKDQHVQACPELKQLRDQNKLLKIELYRRKTVNRKRLRSAYK
uniref:Uncharacterized protein n=1 Tax=Euplotes crassus TaxID=5936 RepID=A0A7S3KQX7_EUPCR|mmetsp:Transcript_40415/g.39984  ORF Transcript_40415/g.39984 Transcript_40415/m.39984 type:complete len:105 (+) Transcript_40415:279-593(+)